MRWLLIVSLGTLVLFGCEPHSTPDFAQNAAMSDMYKIEAGRIATRKGQSAPVRNFGQVMVDAHSQTLEELKGVVHSENLKTVLPTKLDPDHQELIDELNNASGEDFDETYAEQQVEAHDDAEALFEYYAGDGENRALRQFAQKTLPVIRQHLGEARKLP